MERIRQKIEPVFGWEEIPGASEFESAVILLRKKNASYSVIQTWLGNPSKKMIRAVLLKWAPELIENKEVEQKTKSNKDKPSKWEYVLRGLLTKYPTFKYNAFSECPNLMEKWNFCITEGRVYYHDGKDAFMFGDWDEITQGQIVEDIKKQIDGEQN